MALGGSTNATLHLLAIAHAANVDLTLEDFNDFQERVPHLADLKPSGNMSSKTFTMLVVCQPS